MDTDVAMDAADANHPLVEVVEPMDAEVANPSIREEGDAMADDEMKGSYTWTISNFQNQEERQHSETFEVGTHIWRLLVFPRGNKGNPSSMSLYLDAPEAVYTPPNMTPKASFVFSLINHLDASKTFCKEASHTFTAQATDWGFNEFFPIHEILNPAYGFMAADGSVTIRVDVHVQRDERYSYDSRRETGCVGLKNQGATCYMNSLLQYLYHIQFFRKAVYHMPTLENDEASKSLPLALQSVFYKLQYSRTSVSTKDLTKSFGWGTYDAFMQHDVQELNRVLCERLEEKMKGTRVEKVITDLFEGHTYSFIECVNVDYKSTRKESYMDLQLDVKGCKNIYESFSRYCEVEMMDGPNQYKAEGHGLQDARKGVLFDSFPPVLQLQLKRFEYDFQRDAMVKINDRYEFSDILDLDFNNRACLSPNSDASVRNMYKLHSVLVHSGGVNGGHYYAFIKADGKQWLKFDDERVTLEEESRAMEENFGGDYEDGNTGAGYTPSYKYTRHSNAYMLVYVRLSDMERIMCPVSKNDITEHLRHRLEQEQREKELRQKEKQEAHLFCTIKLATDEDLHEQIGSKELNHDLVNHDKLPPQHIFRVKKNTKFIEFKMMVADKMNVPLEAQRYWTWNRRQNGTFRPSRPLKPEEEAAHIVDLRELRDTGAVSKHAMMDLKFFLEVPQKFNKALGRFEKVSGTSLPIKDKNEIFVFIKMYDPATERVSFVGRVHLNCKTLMKEAAPLLAVICGLPTDAMVDVYEEIKFEPSIMVEILDPKSSLQQLKLEDGDILIVQQSVDESKCSCRFPTVVKYLEYVRNRRLVTFKKLDNLKDEGFSLELLRDMNYDAVSEAVASKLGLDMPTKLRLTQHNAYSHQPQRHPIKYRSINKLEAMLQHANHVNEILYYEVLDIPLPELEQLKTLRVGYHNERGELQREHTLRLPKECTVADVLSEVQRMMEAGPDAASSAAALQARQAGRKLRLLEVYNNKLYKVCEDSETIDTIKDGYWNLRAELVPEDQMPDQMQEGERIIHVYHYNVDKETNQLTNFGDPFLMCLKEKETLADIKPRIQAKLGVADEEFANWSFAFVSTRQHPVELASTDVLSVKFAKAPFSNSEVNYLGLRHEDRNPRRAQSNIANNANRLNYDRPVKIYS